VQFSQVGEARREPGLFVDFEGELTWYRRGTTLSPYIRRWPVKLLRRAFMFNVVLAVFVTASCDDNSTPADTPHEGAVQTPQTQAPPASTPVPVHVSLPVPAAEQGFVHAVQQGQAAFRAAPNEMARGGTRFQRRTAICETLPQLSVSGWVGQIEKLSSNSDGKGVLEISFAPNIEVKTWNNALSDVSDYTLIEPSSSLFAAVSQMKQGDQVIFAGTFFPSEVDCVRETSVSLEGSMTDPEFLFRFSNVSPAGASNN